MAICTIMTHRHEESNSYMKPKNMSNLCCANGPLYILNDPLIGSVEWFEKRESRLNYGMVLHYEPRVKNTKQIFHITAKVYRTMDYSYFIPKQKDFKSRCMDI